MTSIKSVNTEHMLKMDINTDTSHLINTKTDKSLISFCKDLVCRDSQGNRLGKIKLISNQWHFDNDINIQTTPAEFNSQGLFNLEVEICRQWLAQQ